MTKLLAILERLQHDMPPALAVRPDDALAAARGAMLVGASLPPVYAEAAKLAAPHQCVEARRGSPWSSAAPMPPHRRDSWPKRGRDLETLTTQKEAEAQAAGGQYGTLKTRLDGIATQAADFQALVSRVAALQAAPAAAAEALSPSRPPMRVPWVP